VRPAFLSVRSTAYRVSAVERSNEVVAVADHGCQRLEPLDDNGIECRFEDPRDGRTQHLQVRGRLPGIQLNPAPKALHTGPLRPLGAPHHLDPVWVKNLTLRP
jgi:hypothetical protein